MLPRLRRRNARHRLAALVTALVLASVTWPGAVQAHVDIDVGEGRYVMEVGFRDEPAYLGQPNALYLNVQEYATGGTEPVDDLAATLQAEVNKDGQTMPLTLVPLGDGEYQAPFVPTATGDYTFRISGTIGEATVDESVTSGPSTFNNVEALTAIEFPVARPDTAALQAEAAGAQTAAGTARTIAIAGLVAGVLGLVVGAVALARSSRRVVAEAKPAPPAAEPSGKLIR